MHHQRFRHLLAAEAPMDQADVETTMGSGPCSFPGCTGGGGFRPCTGYTGTGDDCLNCRHAYNYHA